MGENIPLVLNWLTNGLPSAMALLIFAIALRMTTLVTVFSTTISAWCSGIPDEIRADNILAKRETWTLLYNSPKIGILRSQL